MSMKAGESPTGTGAHWISSIAAAWRRTPHTTGARGRRRHDVQLHSTAQAGAPPAGQRLTGLSSATYYYGVLLLSLLLLLVCPGAPVVEVVVGSFVVGCCVVGCCGGFFVGSAPAVGRGYSKLSRDAAQRAPLATPPAATPPATPQLDTTVRYQVL